MKNINVPLQIKTEFNMSTFNCLTFNLYCFIFITVAKASKVLEILSQPVDGKRGLKLRTMSEFDCVYH